MILVTGAAGKTGQAVIEALARRGTAVRALIRDESKITAVRAVRATEVTVGDMGEAATYQRAMMGVSAVYFICPNVNPNEVQFAKWAIEAAKEAGNPHFVYHSVLHPQIEAMPHHWLKMRVEEILFASGLPFTILQPTAYMQNILANWQMIVEQGIYGVPYSAETRLSLVDLGDVAETAATVLLDSGHRGAIYELCGTAPLSQVAVARIVGEKLERRVVVEEVPLAAWERQAVENGLGRYQIETLMKMFRYYDEYGFYGSPNVLGWLLKRPPTSFADFVERMVDS